MSSEAARLTPLLHPVYNLLILFSAQCHSDAGLEPAVKVLEVERFLLVFPFIKNLMAVVCLRPILLGCFKKLRKTFEKLAFLKHPLHFTRSQLLCPTDFQQLRENAILFVLSRVIEHFILLFYHSFLALTII